MTSKGWGLVLAGATVAQKLTQLALLLQLARTLPEQVYATYGLLVLASGSIFGIIVGVAVNMVIGEHQTDLSLKKSVHGFLLRLSPLLLVYFIGAIVNQLAFGPTDVPILTVILAPVLVGLSNLNTGILSLFASRGSFGRASIGYVIIILSNFIALVFIEVRQDCDLKCSFGALTSASVIAFVMSNILILNASRAIDKVEQVSATLWDLSFFASALKINISGTIFQATVLWSLNWLGTEGSSTDLAQVAFASQIFNQFGFIGIILYPFFLRSRTNESDDWNLVLRWSLFIFLAGLGVSFSVVVGIFFLAPICPADGCFGLSGASHLSIISGIIIGSLMVTRSPIAWMLQLNKFAKVEMITHVIAGSILVLSIAFWATAETFLGLRLISQALLISIPFLILGFKVRTQ